MAAALVIIDVQTSLIEDETWEPDRLLGRVTAIEAAARAAGVPIVYILDSRVEPDGSLHPRLSPGVADRTISKDFCDSFLGTDLHESLQAAGIDRLVVCGLQTDFCVDTTCRRAASLGYKVTLVGDAHSTFDRDYLSAEKVIEHHNRILSRFPAGNGSVRVMSSADIRFG